MQYVLECRAMIRMTFEMRRSRPFQHPVQEPSVGTSLWPACVLWKRHYNSNQANSRNSYLNSRKCGKKSFDCAKLRNLWNHHRNLSTKINESADVNRMLCASERREQSKRRLRNRTKRMSLQKAQWLSKTSRTCLKTRKTSSSALWALLWITSIMMLGRLVPCRWTL